MIWGILNVCGGAGKRHVGVGREPFRKKVDLLDGWNGAFAFGI